MPSRSIGPMALDRPVAWTDAALARSNCRAPARRRAAAQVDDPLRSSTGKPRIRSKDTARGARGLMRALQHALQAIACLLFGAILALFVLDGLDRTALQQELVIRRAPLHHHGDFR